jgi:hypothetical protein
MTELDFSGDRQLAETLLSGFAGNAGRTRTVAAA